MGVSCIIHVTFTNHYNHSQFVVFPTALQPAATTRQQPNDTACIFSQFVVFPAALQPGSTTRQQQLYLQPTGFPPIQLV